VLCVADHFLSISRTPHGARPKGSGALLQFSAPEPSAKKKGKSLAMNRPEAMKKLDAILAKAEAERTYGSIELDLRAGHVVIIRKTETERFEDPTRETTHVQRNFR
jgi:hypothetical protein